VNGMLTQHVMEVVSGEVFGGSTSQRYVDESLREVEQSRGLDQADKRALEQLLGGVSKLNQRALANPPGAGGARVGGLSMPYTTRQEAVTARRGQVYNGMAHSFAGMSVQFILFMGIDAGMLVLAQRRSG